MTSPKPDRREALMSIDEIASRCGISRRTVRYYGTKGLLGATIPGRPPSYDGRAVDRIALIASGKRMGFSLAEIALMLREHLRDTQTEPQRMTSLLCERTMRERIALLERRRDSVDAGIAELRAILAGEGDAP